MKASVLLLVTLLIGGCAAYQTSPDASRPASLTITASIAERCESIGGCRYTASVEGPAGSNWVELTPGADGAAELIADDSQTLTPGTYTVRYSASFLSDSVSNGVVEQGPVIATCAVGFVDTGIGQDVVTHATFSASDCDVDLSTPRRL